MKGEDLMRTWEKVRGVFDVDLSRVLPSTELRSMIPH